ncbi:hypothetical protein C0431_13010 [bacterium]|nr:hypothetical protein [bacterium]
MNHVSLVGRISNDPQLRYGNSGNAVLAFTLATDEPEIKGKDRTTFVRVRVFGKAAETHANVLTKGLLISLQGRINVFQTERMINGAPFKIDETSVVPDDIRYLETRATVDERASRKAAVGPF